MDVVVRIAERKLGASLALNLLALAGACATGTPTKPPTIRTIIRRRNTTSLGRTILRDVDANTVWRHCPQHGVACVIEITDTSCVIEPPRSVPRKVLPEKF
jgi:hypothetical protein